MYFGKGDENSYLKLQKQKSTNGRFFGKDLTNISNNGERKRSISTKRSSFIANKSKKLKFKAKKNEVQKGKKSDRIDMSNRSFTPEFRENDQKKIKKTLKIEKNEDKKTAKDNFKNRINDLVKKREKLKVKQTENFLREKLTKQGKYSKNIPNNKSQRKLSPLTTKEINKDDIITPADKQPKLENKPVDLEKRGRGVRKFDLNQQIEKKSFSKNGILNSLLQKVNEIEIQNKEKKQGVGSFEYCEEEEACDFIFQDPKDIFESDVSYYVSETRKDKKVEIRTKLIENFDVEENGPGADFTKMRHLNFNKVWQLMLKEIVKYLYFSLFSFNNF